MLRRAGHASIRRAVALASSTASTVVAVTSSAPLLSVQMALQGQRGGPSQPPPRGSPQQPASRGAPQQPPQEQQQQPPAPPTKPEKPPQFFKYDVDAKGILTLKLARGPVNSLNLEMFSELNEWLLWFGYDETVKAVILTSEIPMVFSAGLDINELYKPTPARFQEFWTNFQEIWMILNTFPKPVIAAINGNAPAGGCVLALCCDYRIMAKAPAAQPERLYRIGLNEVKLGIVAPPWVMSSFGYVVGTRKAERMLQLGETPTAEEALALGLVDLVVDEATVQAAAVKEAEKLLALPNEARWMSKDMMRRELFQYLGSDEERRYDCDFFTNMVQNPDVTANIGKYLERLGGAKKK